MERNLRRTKIWLPENLRRDTEKKGLEFWTSIQHTSIMASNDELSEKISDQYHNLLDQIVDILPSEENDIDRLEITFHGSERRRLYLLIKNPVIG